MKKNEVVRSKLFPDLPTKFSLFSVAEVSIILGTSTKIVHEWINQGHLHSIRLGPKGKLIRVSHQDLENFIDSNIRTGAIKFPKEDSNIDSKELKQ